MVIGFGGYQVVAAIISSRSSAQAVLNPAVNKLNKEISQIANQNDIYCKRLEQDPSFCAAFKVRDRSATAQAIKSFCDRN